VKCLRVREVHQTLCNLACYLYKKDLSDYAEYSIMGRKGGEIWARTYMPATVSG